MLACYLVGTETNFARLLAINAIRRDEAYVLFLCAVKIEVEGIVNLTIGDWLNINRILQALCLSSRIQASHRIKIQRNDDIRAIETHQNNSCSNPNYPNHHFMD